MTAVSVDFRSKDLPPLKVEESKDIKAYVSGAPKTFDETKPAVQHRMVTMKRHFLYNRQVSSIRAVNRNTVKFADVDCGSPIEQLCPLHYESTAAVALLRDGNVTAISASDMPDKTVKLASTVLTSAEGDKSIANATAICILQAQSTTHSTANSWAHKQILVFSGGDKKDQALRITRIIPTPDGLSAEKIETVTAANTWANTFGSVTSATAGQNGFVAICGSNGGKVQVIHQSDLAKGVLSRVLNPHSDIGAQSAIFLPRDTVTSDSDPTNQDSNQHGDAIMTTAKGGHEVRLWGLRGNAVSLVQTIVISNDKENGERETIVEPSTSDMTFLISKNSGANGTIIAIEPEAERGSFRRITEWSLPEGSNVLSCAACPAPSTGVSQGARFSVFVRTEKGVYRWTFDTRIMGAANVVSSSSATANADDDDKKNNKDEGNNVSKWFGNTSAVAALSGNKGGNDDLADPAIISKSSKEVVSVKAGQRTTTVEGGASTKDVKAAVAEATQQHLASAGKFYEQSDSLVQSLEQAIGQALGALRVPGVRQRSNELAAEWSKKAIRAIEDSVRTAIRNKNGGASSSSANNGNDSTTASSVNIAGFSPTLAQNFYTNFLENIHAAASTVVEHSLDRLLETSVSQAVDKTWPAVQTVVDQVSAGNAASGSGNQIPRVTALPSFVSFSESIQADQSRQNSAVKRQVDQNKRDLAMYESTTGNTKAAELYLAKLQTAVKSLDAAVVAAKAPTTISGVETVTPANEDDVFTRVQKLASSGDFVNATNTVANGGSVSLITRFFECDEIDAHFETVCSPKGMTPASFLTVIRLLSRGLTSAAAVALTSRVTLLKRILVPYALAIDEEQQSNAASQTIAFLKSSGRDVDDVRNELNRVQGPDRQTVKNAKLAIRALNVFDDTE